MDKETLKHVLNILRRGTITWKGRTESLNKKRVKRNTGKYKNGKVKYKYYYNCDSCNEEFTSSASLEVDHIDEVGPFKGDFNEYIKRMYCEQSNLQNLCSVCHQKKTSRFNASLTYRRKKL